MTSRSNAVVPRDCALAIAIPLTREQFLNDLADSAPKDFAKMIRERTPLRADLLWERYRRLADLVERVAAVAASLEVTVSRTAGLDEISDLLSGHKVLTVIAHHVFPLLTEADVLNAEAVLARVRLAAARPLERDDADGEGEDSAAELLSRNEAVLAARNAHELVRSLNAMIAATRDYYGWSPDVFVGSRSAMESLATRPAAAGLTRVLLEECFPDCFAPARCLEMTEGLCTVWDLIDAIPPGFGGVLDLTACSSLGIAEAIKRSRPHCTILATKQPAAPDVRSIIYRAVVRSLARHPEPFVEVMARAHIELTQTIRRSDDEHA